MLSQSRDTALQVLRMLCTSHLFLCLIATQVFQQVWNLATGWPITGLLITCWLCWKLGGMAGHADMTTLWSKRERLIAADIADFQQWFESLPADQRLELGHEWAEVMMRLTSTHQKVIAMRDLPYDPPKFSALFGYFGRRRERKILATAKVQH